MMVADAAVAAAGIYSIEESIVPHQLIYQSLIATPLV